MTDHPHPRPNRPQGLEFLDPVAVVRGLLIAALARVQPTSGAAAEIRAAWAELDEHDTRPEQVDAGIQGVLPPEVILAMARNVLNAAILTVTTETVAYPLARAIGHLHAAAAHLRAEVLTHPVVVS